MEGRSKLIGKNRQYIISFTLTTTTGWNIRLNQLSRREVSVDTAAHGWTIDGDQAKDAQSSKVCASTWMEIIYAYSPCKQ
jgi:hypothetical protein